MAKKSSPWKPLIPTALMRTAKREKRIVHPRPNNAHTSYKNYSPVSPVLVRTPRRFFPLTEGSCIATGMAAVAAAGTIY